MSFDLISFKKYLIGWKFCENSEFGIWEFENSFGEHLKLNFKINDICCRSCSSSFCRLGCWGCNYNILLRFCILHPLRDSWDQTSIPLFHEFTKKINTLFYSLISIRQNYNFDMLATIWHEIASWFLTIYQDLRWFSITKLFLFWHLDIIQGNIRQVCVFSKPKL